MMGNMKGYLSEGCHILRNPECALQYLKFRLGTSEKAVGGVLPERRWELQHHL